MKKMSVSLCVFGLSVFVAAPTFAEQTAEQTPSQLPSDSINEETSNKKIDEEKIDKKKVDEIPISEATESTPVSPADKIVKDVLSDAGAATQSPLEHADKPSLMQEGIKTIAMLSVLLVVFWWFSNWLKKSGRLARLAGAGSDIQCVSVFSVGQKEKIALLKVRDQELLVGITQTNIQTLHHFGQGQTEKDAPSAMEFSTILDKTDTKPQTTA